MSTPADDRAAQARADAARLRWAAAVLRSVAAHDMHVSRARGEVGVSLAALVDACGPHLRELPEEVVRSALSVVTAVEKAETLPDSAP